MPDLRAPQQQVSVIPNKKDEDGNNYLKVLLLSNKLTKNKWIAPYKRIGDLPKELLDSYKEIPGIQGHNHELFDKLDDIFKSEGLTREQRYEKLRQESIKANGGYVDHIFLDNPDATALYGQFKVTSKEENEYINTNKEPSNHFTSPAISGVYEEDENGIKTYDVNTMRAFHLGFLDKPAFDEEEAQIQGVCINGNSETCREALAYAGDDSSTVTPIENVNKTCGCNNNISMTDSKIETQPSIPSSEGPIPQGENTTTVFKNQPEVKYTIEDKVTDSPKGSKSNVTEDKGEVFKSQREIDAENREKELQATIQKLQKQSEQQQNFYLDELLVTHIPKEIFKKEEEYEGEKTNIKNFILKYNVSLEDAKWFIKKSVPKTIEVEKKNQKDSNQYAGTMFNSSAVTKPAFTAPSKPTVNNDDYPIGF